MLERFTPEEIEQIKKELGFASSARFTKRKVIESMEESNFLDELFPNAIEGVPNNARNAKTVNCLLALVDAITGNYTVSGRGMSFSKTLNKELVGSYQTVYRDVVTALRRIYTKNCQEREKNIKAVLNQVPKGKDNGRR